MCTQGDVVLLQHSSQHATGPYCRSVVLSSEGSGPVAALTSVCNGALSQVGRFEFGAMGFCCSSDSTQWTPIESQFLWSGSDGVLLQH